MVYRCYGSGIVDLSTRQDAVARKVQALLEEGNADELISVDVTVLEGSALHVGVLYTRDPRAG